MIDTLLGEWVYVIVLLAASFALRSAYRRGAGGYLALYVVCSSIMVLLFDYLLWDITTSAEWHGWLLIKVAILSVIALGLAKRANSKWWIAIGLTLALDYIANFSRLMVAIYPDMFPDPAQFATMFYSISYIVAAIEVASAYGRDSGSIHIDIKRLCIPGLRNQLYSANRNSNKVQ